MNASSIVGIYGNFGQTNYVATKAGVIGMTRVWARELGKRGIRQRRRARLHRHRHDARHARARAPGNGSAHPVGRMGQPEDVAYAYLFLASEEASFINGPC